MPVDTESVVTDPIAPPVVPPVDDKAAPVPPTEPKAEQELPLVDSQVESEPEAEPEIEESVESKPFSEYKDAFALHPELRATVAREKAFSELYPKFSEAKQLREWFPSLEDAERIVSEAGQLQTQVETFKSDPAAYMDSLKETDQAAFDKLIGTLPTYLSEDPDRYASLARPVINTVLDNLYAAAQQSGDKAFVEMLTQVASRGLGINLGGYRPARAEVGNSETERLRKQLAERDAADRERAFATFETETNTQYTGRVQGEIDKLVDGSTFPDAVKETIKGKIWTAVNAALGNQPATKQKAESLYAKARTGKATRAEQLQLVEFLAQRAGSLLPSLYKGEAAKWSKVVVKKNQSEIERKQSIANTTKDAGSGAGANGSARPAAAPTGQPRTKEQVLAEARSGMYRR